MFFETLRIGKEKSMNITLKTAADKLVKEIFGVKSGETVIITADDDSDASVVEAVKNSAKNAGAHAMVISVPTPGGVGKAADPDLPVDALSAALLCADVWIEFNHQWLLYSTPFSNICSCWCIALTSKIHTIWFIRFPHKRTAVHITFPHSFCLTVSWFCLTDRLSFTDSFVYFGF